MAEVETFHLHSPDVWWYETAYPCTKLRMTQLTEIIVKTSETEKYNQNKCSEESQTGSFENLGAILHAWIYRIICRNNSKTLLFFTKMQKEIQLYYAY